MHKIIALRNSNLLMQIRIYNKSFESVHERATCINGYILPLPPSLPSPL